MEFLAEVGCRPGVLASWAPFLSAEELPHRVLVSDRNNLFPRSVAGLMRPGWLELLALYECGLLYWLHFPGVRNLCARCGPQGFGTELVCYYIFVAYAN